ncbi:MAG: L-histidine N(alpha)-methyltransferase [Maricaulaceae bacterium]|jgi:dimethylhistidine N-methyltransferase
MLDNTATIEDAFARDVLEGLALEQKAIPSRWLYDERGSELFEQITDLPEYYLTRTETAILKDKAGEIARAAGAGATLVEYGAGASVKTRLLIDAFEDLRAYVPIDLSAEFLEQSAAALSDENPGLDVVPIVADFLGPIDLDKAPIEAGGAVGFFPGSTIGNLNDDEIATFLRRAREDLGEGARFVLGADLRKDPAVLIDAYDDAAGVTAAFNLNLLERINRELGGDFDIARYSHEARWNEPQSRIEMHIVSEDFQTATVRDEAFKFARRETIHTENSRKFSIDDVAALGERSGWALTDRWTDEDDLFAVLMLRAA